MFKNADAPIYLLIVARFKIHFSEENANIVKTFRFLFA
jgi:hypothetical protein